MYSEQFKRLWDDYKKWRIRHEDARNLANGAYATMKRIEGELVDAMMDADATNFEIDGMKPYLSADRDCSVTRENIAEVEQWLEEQRGGKANFERTAVDPWAVKRLVREELKDGADPTSYPSFLKVAIRPRLNVKGWIGGEEGGDDSDTK